MADLNTLPLAGPGSLPELLEQLTDPRARRGIRHKISVTLAMVVAAGLSGCARSFRSVGDFAADLPRTRPSASAPAGTRPLAATSPLMRRRSEGTSR